jgi:hypothetical protein
MSSRTDRDETGAKAAVLASVKNSAIELQLQSDQDKPNETRQSGFVPRLIRKHIETL